MYSQVCQTQFKTTEQIGDFSDKSIKSTIKKMQKEVASVKALEMPTYKEMYSPETQVCIYRKKIQIVIMYLKESSSILTESKARAHFQ